MTEKSVAPANRGVEKADATGKVVVDENVIAKIVGLAIREVEGVHDLGGGAARMVGLVRDAVGRTDLTQGVSVETGETQVAVDISLVALYPHPLQKVAANVRQVAADAISELVGMEIAEINVSIKDVFFPSEDKKEEKQIEEPRVK